MREIESAREAPCQQMKDFIRGKVPHDFVQNFYEMRSRFLSLAKALQLGLCFPEGRPQRLHFVFFLCLQTL